MTIKIGIYCTKFLAIAISFTALFGCEVGPQQSISMRKHNSQKVECFGDRSLQAQVRTIGIVPQFTAEAIWTKWGPFLSEIGKNTNLCFQLYVERSIPSFEEQISNGKYDYAYINPIHQVMTKNNYIPLVKNGSSLLSGVIIVHPDSKMETIQDAEGKDLHIVKSLSEEVLARTKFIAIECPHDRARYDGESTKNECIQYFDTIGFDVFFCHDTNNGSGISDVVFINRNNS